MSLIKRMPITWHVHRLMCECGGEMEHRLNIGYADKPFVHSCGQCGAQENMEHVYPRTVWQDGLPE